MSPTNVAGRGAAALGDALSNVGQQLGQIAVQDKAKESQEADNMARAKAANATADYNLRTEMATADVEDQLRTGTLDYAKAPAALDTVLSKIEVPQIEGLHPDTQETYSGGMGRIRQAAGLKIQGAVVSARRDDGQKQAAQLLDTLDKQAGLRGADIGAIAAQARASIPLFQKFGLDASTLQTAVENKIGGMYVNQAATRANDAAQDITALKALQHDLGADDGTYADKIDPDKRTAMAASVAAQIGRVESAARVELDKRETVAGGVVKDVIAQAVSGIPPTVDMVAAWQTAVAGTAHGPAFKVALGQVLEVQQVRRSPPGAQATWLADKEAKLNQGGTPADLQRLNTVRSALEHDQKQQREDPLQYIENMTGKPPAPLPLAGLATGDVAGIGQGLADRMASLEALRKQGFPVAMKPLQEAELVQLQGLMATIPPAKLLDLYAPLRASAGSDRAYAAVMEQLAPGAPLKAYAGELAVKPRGRMAADLVLRGEALLSGKGDQKWAMPADAKFTEAFVEASGNAYQGRPEALQRDLAAARAAYAASAAQDGDTGAQTEINASRFDNSMQAVRGQIAEIAGTQTTIPWGMDPGDFEDRAKVLMREAMVAAGLDESASGVGLLATPQGRYILVQGRTPIENPKARRADGRPMPVFIDFKAAPPEAATKPNRNAAYDATTKGTR
ncbi:MAG: hypothetical protein M3Q15_05200 [Pseudomonadota bacterium]|nr:hypothetical protein [Pseudomonadota bacterium]